MIYTHVTFDTIGNYLYSPGKLSYNFSKHETRVNYVEANLNEHKIINIADLHHGPSNRITESSKIILHQSTVGILFLSIASRESGFF